MWLQNGVWKAVRPCLFPWVCFISDVVHAYKNLSQEKEALEASVTALSAAGGQAGNSSEKEQPVVYDDPLGAKSEQVREQIKWLVKSCNVFM